MTSSTTQVDQSTSSEQDDVLVTQEVSVDLRLNVGDRGGVLVQPSDVDFNVKVTDAIQGMLLKSARCEETILPVRNMTPSPMHGSESTTQRAGQYSLANDRILRHDLEMLVNDDVPASGSGNKDVSSRSSVFHSGDFVSGHGSLQSVDGVNLGDEDSGSVRSERFGTLQDADKDENNQRLARPQASRQNVYVSTIATKDASTHSFSDISETGNNGDLSSQHDVGSTLDTVNEGFSASVLSMKKDIFVSTVSMQQS